VTRDEAAAFTQGWIEAWNRGDLEAVLAAFSDDVVFTSPRALEVLGTERVRGKTALRAYWLQALARIGSLRFVLDHALWDERERALAIVYTAHIDGRARRVIEHLRFDQRGRVIAGEVFHGVAPP
jgi:hypothetical protein